MGLILIEGFDTYGTGQWAGKWSAQSGTISAVGREGTNGLTTTGSFQMVKPVGNIQTLIAGCAFKLTGSKAWDILLFKDGGTNQIGVFLDASFQLIVKRGTTILSSTGYNLIPDTWYYLEFKAIINQSPNGSWELRINGVEIDSQTGIDTQQTGASYATNVEYRFFGFGAGEMWIDDIYIFDISGSFCNDFVGDVHVDASFPDADGYLTEWIPEPTGGGNYTKVDDTVPDDDTTFVVTSGLGNIDSYEFGALTTLSGSVYGVQVNTWGRKDDIGDRQVNATVRPSVTTFSGGTPVALGSTYAYQTFEFEVNPETNDYWTIAQINATEFGIKQEV